MTDLRFARALLALVVAIGSGCGGQGGEADSGDGDADRSDASDPDSSDPDVIDPWDSDIEGAPPRAVLEIVGLDIWAQPLPEDVASLEVSRDGRPVGSGLPVTRYVLRAPLRLAVRLEADRHVPFDATVSYDGSDASGAVTVSHDAGLGHGVSVRRGTFELDGVRLPLHTVYVGLRHRWFSAQGRPARRGNRLGFLMDGEDAWAAVHRDLRDATESVHLATWWWTSDFELVRDPVLHPYLDATERRANTIMGTLQASGADKRVIVGQFLSADGVISWLTSDDELRACGAAAGDGFEFMGQANETRGTFWFEVEPFVFGERVREAFPEGGGFDPEPEVASTVPPHLVDLSSWPVGLDVQHGSWHQKFTVVDERVAYVGGMNLRPVDWDTSEHLVYEERRMDFGATTASRLDVRDRDRLPDNGPRKDYMVRIEGPAVQDVSEVFHTRWSHLLAIGVRYSESSSGFEVGRGQAGFADGVQAQVTATMPAPFGEHAIAESWFNAIANAERFILVEDQYWRVPMLVDAIIARMEEVPDLELVVVTKPVDPRFDPGCAWTHRTHQALLARFADRYHVFQLRAFDFVVTWGIDETESRFVDIDAHSKLLVVDDLFLSVGSANKNNRGIVFEGELNLAVLDAAWVTEARRRVVGNMLGPGGTVSDDPAVWIEAMEEAAARNEQVYFNWEAEGWDISLDGAPLPASYQPVGFLYPLGFGTLADCWLETVGPDQS